MKTQLRENRTLRLSANADTSTVIHPPAPPAEEAPTRATSLVRRALPTLEGVVWLGLAVFFISLRAFNLVTLIGSFMLGMLLLNWLRILFRGNLRHLRLRREVQRGAHAGENAQVTLLLRNAVGQSQPGLAVSERGSSHLQRWSLPTLGGSETQRLSYQVLLPRRGRYFLGPVEIISGYPFGLFRSGVSFENYGEILALPELGTLHRGRLRRLLHAPTQPTPLPERHLHRRSSVPAEFYGVRDFRPGDSPRFIHWRTTARVGMPMVREFEETPLDHLIVILDAWLPQPARELYGRWAELRDRLGEERVALQTAGQRGAAMLRRQVEEQLAEEAPLRRPLDMLERAISLAATLCAHWQQNVGTELVLAIADQQARVPGRLASNRGVLTHLEALALVEGGPTPAGEAVIRQLADMELPDGPLLVISTRASTLAGSLRASLRHPVTLLNVAEPAVFDYFTTPAQAVLL